MLLTRGVFDGRYHPILRDGEPVLKLRDVPDVDRVIASAMEAVSTGRLMPGWRLDFQNAGGGYTICDASGRPVAHTARVVRADGVEVVSEAEAKLIACKLALP